MELSYDWRGFQSVFYPRKRVVAPQASGAVYCVIDGERVVSVYGENEDFSDWIGSPYSEMAAEMVNRELYLFDRAKVDECVTGSLTLPHFYDQVEYLRGEAHPQILTSSRLKKGKNEKIPFRRHFLLQSIQTWWAKVLPSAYGVFIRLEGPAARDFFFVVRRGRLDSFLEPDLVSMGKDRRNQSGDVVKYLSEKYLVPVQGIFVKAEDWDQWTDVGNPWPKVAAALKANQLKLVPFKWGLATLIATRAFLGL
ncbi:MAG: hypothetical protein ACXWP5_05670 [Bdellovibrionota bacterium]